MGLGARSRRASPCGQNIRTSLGHADRVFARPVFRGAILDAVDDAAESAPKRENYADIRDFIRDWENYWDQAKPSTSAILRRAAIVANDAAAAIEMQIGRIRESFRSRDQEVLDTVLIDIEFLISSLWKMRQAGKLTLSVMGQSWTALSEFDTALPHLKLMRDVLEHIDEYGRDADGRARRHRHPRTGQLIGRRYLHSQMSYGDTSFNWLGGTLEFHRAREVAFELLSAIRTARDNADSAGTSR